MLALLIIIVLSFALFVCGLIWNKDEGVIIGGVVLVLTLGFCMGYDTGQSAVRKEAVKNQVAHWEPKSETVNELVWHSPETEGTIWHPILKGNNTK
jgi:hypothetical protein